MARQQGQQPSAKKPKLEPVTTNNVIVQFQADTGNVIGPQLDVPQAVTPLQLETLLNRFLESEEKVPYSFYVDDHQVVGPLGEHLQKHAVSVETALRIVFQPQAVFRVRPVTRCSASLAGHSEAILCVQFSPDGRQLATGAGDCTVRFWDLNTQTPLLECKAHRDHVLCVSWAPDNSCLASASKDGTLYLWDGRSATPLGCLRGHTKFVTSVAWEPLHMATPCRRLCSGSRDGTIKVWDAQTKRCLMTMCSHTKAVTCVKWGGEGRLYSASRDTNINVWDAKDGSLVYTLKGHAHWVNHMALSTDYALRVGAHDHMGKAPKDPNQAQKVALERYETARGGHAERLVTASDDRTVFLWDPQTSNKPLARLTGHVQLVNQVCFSPDGRWIASASFDKCVKLWDGVTGAFVATLLGHVGPVYQVSWSSDSRLLVSGSKDSTLKVWDLSTKKMKLELPGHADEVFSVDWSPDGSSVASGSKDRFLRIWRH